MKRYERKIEKFAKRFVDAPCSWNCRIVHHNKLAADFGMIKNHSKQEFYLKRIEWEKQRKYENK
ncbi:MAG: hypothetical protein ACLU30_00560 [Odoribacter splanchnicus]